MAHVRLDYMSKRTAQVRVLTAPKTQLFTGLSSVPSTGSSVYRSFTFYRMTSLAKYFQAKYLLPFSGVDFNLSHDLLHCK